VARKKPCEWCGEEQIIKLSEPNGKINVDATLEIYPDNGFMGIGIIQLNDEGEMVLEENYDIPMNYCPNCGRKLM
jgi:predicted RNA-binding Zn-ribbon protein involved in translation (DUF1610 family)